MTALHTLLSVMEVDRDDHFVMKETKTKGHRGKLKTTTYRTDVKKFSFSHSSIEAWNVCTGMKGGAC